jgi:hypothetical protein
MILNISHLQVVKMGGGYDCSIDDDMVLMILNISHIQVVKMGGGYDYDGDDDIA